MKIQAVRHAVAPLQSDIRNAVIDFSQMTVSVVAVESDVTRNGRALVGYGFNSNGRYAQAGILDARILPRLMAAEAQEYLDEDGRLDPLRAWDIMMKGEKPGGHGDRSVAVGTVDMALWDLAAKIEDKPLYQVLRERFGCRTSGNEVFVYAAGGYYYPAKDRQQLREEMRGYLDMGYDTVKMKIGGASLDEDVKRIDAVLAEVGDASRVAVDANGRFDLEAGLSFLAAIDVYGLKWLEELGDPLDYALNQVFCERAASPIATGENLFSMQDTRNLLRYGGMRADRDILQMDPVLSYGLPEYLRSLAALRQAGWSPSRCVPHGGHQFALHIACAFGLGGNESYPHVFKPFGGFGDNVAISDGRVRIPDNPGVGFELKQDLMAVFTAIP